MLAMNLYRLEHKQAVAVVPQNPAWLVNPVRNSSDPNDRFFAGLSILEIRRLQQSTDGQGRWIEFFKDALPRMIWRGNRTN